MPIPMRSEPIGGNRGHGHRGIEMIFREIFLARHQPILQNSGAIPLDPTERSPRSIYVDPNAHRLGLESGR